MRCRGLAIIITMGRQRFHPFSFPLASPCVPRSVAHPASSLRDGGWSGSGRGAAEGAEGVAEQIGGVAAVRTAQAVPGLRAICR
jgi:hypothetical protein